MLRPAAGWQRGIGTAAVGSGPSRDGGIGHLRVPVPLGAPALLTLCQGDQGSLVPLGLGAWVAGERRLPAAPNLSLLFCRVPWAQSRVGDPRLSRGSCSRGAAPTAPSCCPSSGWGEAGAAPSPRPLSPLGQRCPAMGEPVPGSSHGGHTPPSPGRIPWVHGRAGDRFGSGGCLSSPSPAEKKVSSSPMKAVEGTDMMKAGGCPLPWEERCFPVASPPPRSRAAPRLAARSAALPPPLPTARWLSKPKAEHVVYLQSEGFGFASPPRLVRVPCPHSPFNVSAPVSSFTSRSVCGRSGTVVPAWLMPRQRWRPRGCRWGACRVLRARRAARGQATRAEGGQMRCWRGLGGRLRPGCGTGAGQSLSRGPWSEASPEGGDPGASRDWPGGGEMLRITRAMGPAELPQRPRWGMPPPTSMSLAPRPGPRGQRRSPAGQTDAAPPAMVPPGPG